MASYPGLNNIIGKYDLGPPAYGVTESTPPNSTRNLARKLRQAVPKKWEYVAENLAAPAIVNGLYAVYEGLSHSWWNDTKLTGDPRSLIMLQSILPDTPVADPEVALRTADKMWEIWGDARIHGWGLPVFAINSARIGNAERAIYHLTAHYHWKFDDAGFAIRGGDGGTPPPFMPGNAGFLLPIALVSTSLTDTMAPSFSRVSSGALLLALAYNARPVNADFSEDVDNCKLVLDDLPADLTTDFCHDWTSGYAPEDASVTVTGSPVTITEYPDATTCEGEGYSTTTEYPEYPESTPESSEGYSTAKYPEATPESSQGYPALVPTNYYNASTTVPYGSTVVPYQTTKLQAPDQSPPPYAPGGYGVTVTSTVWTTYWLTSTIYEGYPTETPAPYRRNARSLQERASWCVDRPCRLVQYDDDTIFEACKKYLGWEPTTSTVNVPGYTVTVTSYPTDCKKPESSYVPESVSAYPTSTDDGYNSEPYPIETAEPYSTADQYDTTTTGYPEYPTETPEYEPAPYSTTDQYDTTTTEYPEYPTETPVYPTESSEYEPAPYATAPASYQDDQPNYEPSPYPTATASYQDDQPNYEPSPTPYPGDDSSYGDDGSDDGSDDGQYNDGTAPWDNDNTDDPQHSDDKQPGENDFDTNYTGPDGPLPWDDADQTTELADAIDAGGYDYAASKLGLTDAPWNALPADYPQPSDS
ncbi:hypothetical protein N0V86_002860 [Didymella sp. IMI 355093]|nr:hypothetical protein N0V86_002860 [Didymella sp. IMI 355093]